MRLSAEWMMGVDDRILEFLRENGHSTPTKMAEDGRIKYTRTYINVRCKKLAEYGLVLHLGNGVYQITEEGEAYLDGELDASELEADEE